MIIVVNSKNIKFNGTIMELITDNLSENNSNNSNSKFFIVKTNEIIDKNRYYTYKELQELYGDFTYKEMLFD